MELINNHKFADGRMLAERTCDELELDRSILPVHPKWYSPLLVDLNPPKFDEISSEEWQRQKKEIREDMQHFWAEERAQALADGSLENVAEIDRITHMTEEESKRLCEEYTREIWTKE